MTRQNGLFYNYIWYRDVLPLSKALERGVYNKNGMINVFKDTAFTPKRVTRLQWYKLFLKEDLE